MSERINPVPRTYNPENPDERQTAIIEAIMDFCNIDDEHEHLPAEPEKLWPLIWQVLRIISTITCWDDLPNDLFLTQYRLQSYDAKSRCDCRPNCCDCDENYIIIPLDYVPYPDEPFVGGTLVYREDGKFVKEELTAEYLNEHLNQTRDTLYIPRADWDALHHCCLRCDRDVYVDIEYNAGYDEIPAGLFPAICYLLNKVQNGTDDTDCHDNMTQTSGLLKRKKVGNVEYEWSTQDTTTSKTATLYSDLHDVGMLAEVLAVSRCYLASQQEEIGCVV